MSLKELEELELSLCDLCLWCRGAKYYENEGKSYWCVCCGGSGVRCTRIAATTTPLTLYLSVAADLPAPYLERFDARPRPEDI